LVDPSLPTGASGYTQSTSLTLIAAPASGWRFVEWLDDAGGSDNPLQIVLTGNTTIGARFEKGCPICGSGAR
jgi:hypothetical protein